MDVKTIGSSIYLCEGTKGYRNTKGVIAKRIEVCSCDSRIIKLFLEYLRTLNIDEKKLRGRMVLHQGDNEEEAKEYWSRITNIPKDQFIATSWRKSSNWNDKRLKYGTMVVRYGSVKIFDRIMKDIEEIFGNGG